MSDPTTQPEVQKFDITKQPEELKKARTKLLYFSLFIIVVTIFEPTMTGFLGNFSIKVNAHPEVFVSLIIFVLFWLFIRYASLFSALNLDGALVFSPVKFIHEIYLIITSNEKEKIQLKSNLVNLTRNLKTLKTDKENATKQLKNLVELDKGIELQQNKINKTEQQLKTIKNQETGIKYLIVMDLIAPLAIFFVAIMTIVFSYSNWVEKISATPNEKIVTEYQVDSVILEAKDIKLKQVNP